ncbi:hypothetical protein GZ78_21240 [Endozoicomonas numazuensis]|uniref:Uncharacterized protein n=2 Tax=Endozoicomonas numazuensis TaxID=1137799 RepID=A0A081ND73_9GAMM|nr:hypothetical protein GZ78_21240 [Endozoicomonas numazuensis]
MKKNIDDHSLFNSVILLPYVEKTKNGNSKGHSSQSKTGVALGATGITPGATGITSGATGITPGATGVTSCASEGGGGDPDDGSSTCVAEELKLPVCFICLEVLHVNDVWYTRDCNQPLCVNCGEKFCQAASRCLCGKNADIIIACSECREVEDFRTSFDFYYHAMKHQKSRTGITLELRYKNNGQNKVVVLCGVRDKVTKMIDKEFITIFCPFPECCNAPFVGGEKFSIHYKAVHSWEPDVCQLSEGCDKKQGEYHSLLYHAIAELEIKVGDCFELYVNEWCDFLKNIPGRFIKKWLCTECESAGYNRESFNPKRLIFKYDSYDEFCEHIREYHTCHFEQADTCHRVYSCDGITDSKREISYPKMYRLIKKEECSAGIRQ